MPPPSCCHPARASRAPSSKKLRFCFRAPVLRPGEVRGATSLELRPVISFPSLAQTHMFFLASASFDCFLVIPRSPSPLSAPIFFVSAQFNVYGIIEWRSISIATAVSQREPSADATLMLLQQNTMSPFWFSASIESSCSKAKSLVPLLFTQEFADNVASPPTHPFRWLLLLIDSE